MRVNCWEYKQCGLEAGGSHVAQRGGVCPASTATTADGCNHGLNGGRICWSIAATLCDGSIQGTLTQKFLDCRRCDFFKMVAAEEGVDRFLLSRKSTSASADSGPDGIMQYDGRIITLTHFQRGLATDAEVLANALRQFVRNHPNDPIAVIHNATMLQHANHEYRDVFVRVENELADRIAITAAVFPDTMMRLLARTVHLLSGRSWQFFRTVDEASDFLTAKGFSSDHPEGTRSNDSTGAPVTPSIGRSPSLHR